MKILGIDIGTTTISAVVVSYPEGKTLSSLCIKNDSFLTAENTWKKEQDPARILERVMSLVEDTFSCYDIERIGLTGQMHGILYTDKDGNHVSPLYTWQDQRGSYPCFDGKSICDLLREEKITAYPGYGLITHLYHCRQGLVPQSAVKLCTIMDYLGMVMTGRKTPLMHSSNAASLGLYDVRQGCFQTEILEKMGADAGLLPEVTQEFEVLGTYRGVPVCTAIGDNQASFLGSVRDAENSILVNMGTGGQISVFSEKYFSEKSIEARPLYKGAYLLVGASLCGGRAYAVLADFFRECASVMNAESADIYAVMEKMLAEYIPGEEKLKIRTSFSGTRDNPQKRGVIKNISTENFTPASVVCGVLEGMADELYKMYRKIEKGTGISRNRMIASGNGLRKNEYLQKIMEDRFEMELEMAASEEEAACGAAQAAARIK